MNIVYVFSYYSSTISIYKNVNLYLKSKRAPKNSFIIDEFAVKR
jgi:hypothetical protein